MPQGKIFDDPEPLTYNTEASECSDLNNLNMSIDRYDQQEKKMEQSRHTTILFVIMLLLSLITVPYSLAAMQGYEKTFVDYQVPDIVLTNQDGKSISLIEYMEADQPVMLEFIFATCTTICPVMSVGFTNLQRRLGDNSEKVRLVSVSIDPEHDTPKIMKKYLKRYNARKGWDFLTGTKEDIDQLMKSFDAYVSDKMNHKPLTFMRSTQRKNWVRINGLLSGKDMMYEYKKLRQ